VWAVPNARPTPTRQELKRRHTQVRERDDGTLP
jgi:hypothetical protein